MIEVLGVFYVLDLLIIWKHKGRYRKVSYIFLILSVLSLVLFFYKSQTCTAYFCGLGELIWGFVISGALLLTSIVTAAV
jgi:hypothetical protein